MSTIRLARRLVAGACAGVVLVLLGATGAFGAFKASNSASHRASSNAIVLPLPTLTITCVGGGSGKATLSASWSAPSMSVTTGSTPTFLKPYTVLITVDGSQQYTQSGGSTTSYSSNLAMSHATHTASMTVGVSSTANWSASSTVSTSKAC